MNHFTFLPKNGQAFQCIHILTNTYFLCFSFLIVIAILVGMKWYHVTFWFIVIFKL